MFWFLFIPLLIKVSLFRRPYLEHPLWIYVVFNIDRRQGTWKPICIIPEDHIDPRRSALFLARSVLGAYSDGRHQYLFDVIAKRQRHQRYRRPFRRGMNLRGSWQTATQPLSRLSGNGATATVFRIMQPNTLPSPAPPPSLDHPDTQRRRPWRMLCAKRGCGVTGRSIGRGARAFSTRLCLVRVSDPCLRRRGAGRLRDRKAKDDTPKHSGLKASAPGYIHIDVKYPPHMANGTSRGYLFVAIDRASRRVFIAMYRNKTAATAGRFLGDLERACPIRIRTILTDNGKAFTDRLFGVRRRAVTRQRAFETLCSTLGIEHRLTPPRSPQTNGMVERFNGRIEDVLESLHFRSGEGLGTTLHRYVWLYNHPLAQSALGSKTPLARHETMAQTQTGNCLPNSYTTSRDVTVIK